MARFKPIISAMNTAGVQYVVVGGVATVLHGHARLTVDIDFVIRLEEQNITAAVTALGAAGFKRVFLSTPSTSRMPTSARAGFARRA